MTFIPEFVSDISEKQLKYPNVVSHFLPPLFKYFVTYLHYLGNSNIIISSMFSTAIMMRGVVTLSTFNLEILCKFLMQVHYFICFVLHMQVTTSALLKISMV